MALKLKKTIKGIDIEYWVITQIAWGKLDNQTYVVIGGYKDAPTRQEDITNFIQETSQQFRISGYQTIDNCYKLLKDCEVEIGGKMVKPFENAEDC